MTVSEGEALISRYRVVSGTDTDAVDAVEIELPDWIYPEVVEMNRPDVLIVHPNYFLREPELGRFLYRLARRPAGKGHTVWSLRTIYEHYGSAKACLCATSCHIAARYLIPSCKIAFRYSELWLLWMVVA